MKKTISILLVCSMLFSVMMISVGAENVEAADLKLAVASDLHYMPVQDTLSRDIDDEVFWYANRRAAMENESGFIIDEFLNQCAENEDVEYVLIAGDLANDGRTKPGDHEAVADKLKTFEEKTGKSVYVINGNHDAADNSNTTYSLFKEIYADFGYDKALAKREDDCSYTAELGEKYLLIALDSNNPDDSTADGMTLDKINWVKQQTEYAKEVGRYPILMMHHNLLDHMPAQRILSRNFIVKFHYTTAELFADWGIKLVLTGHEHCSDATVYTSAMGNKIYDFATTSLTMYPLQYRVFYFSDNEIQYVAKTIDKIDTFALLKAQPEFTAKQIDLMNRGFNDYAKAFLKAGVQYRLELSLTMEKMGIGEDDIYYDLVNTAVTGLVDLLNMPLYGKNSVQSLAEEYAIIIPESEYETGWDLATDLVAMHYAGEEAYHLESTEITILLRMLALVLRTDLPHVNDEVFMSATTAFLSQMGYEPFSESITKLCCNAFGAVKPGEYFTVALISPLLFEFAYDSDGVNDNQGTIEGYNIKTCQKNTENVFDKMKNIMIKLITYIELFMNMIIR